MGVAVIGRGTRRELALCRRAVRVALAHLNVAKQGLTGAADSSAAFLRRDLLDTIASLNSLGAPMRKGKNP